MPVNMHNAIVVGSENKSRLGNQHGKHTSNTRTHLLSLATGRNLVCFVCFYVMFLWSLEQRDHYKRKKKNFCISAQPESLGTCGTGQVPVPLLTQEKRGSTCPSPLSPWFPPHPTWQLGTFSISSSGKAGNWLFLWNEHDPEKHLPWSDCVLERVLSWTSCCKVFELLFIKAPLEPHQWTCSLPGRQYQSFGTESPQLLACCST